MPGFAHVRAVCYVAKMSAKKMSAKKAADEAELFRNQGGRSGEGGTPPKIGMGIKKNISIKKE